MNFNQKIKTFAAYRNLFRNWPYAAFARYLGRCYPRPRLLRFRDGRKLVFRPASDAFVLGEVFIMEVYAQCLKGPEPVRVWDVGGNVGAFPVWLSGYFPRATYVSFEPCAESFTLLEQTRRGNQHIAWVTHPYGLSDKDEVVEGRIPPGHCAKTSAFAQEGRRVSLPLRSVDAVWREKESPRIDLLKLDCEGGEYDILLGCSDAFLRAVHSIIGETHIIPGHHPEQLRHRLNASGFHVKWYTGKRGIFRATRDMAGR